MTMPSPPLLSERQALISRIARDFASVSRDGGTSWTEAFYLDGPGARMPMAERLKIRAEDKDRRWTELVDDPAWSDEGPHNSNWSFVDAVGYRYYLPAAMTRFLRDGQASGGMLVYSLRLSTGKSRSAGDYQRQQWSLLNDAQRRCVRDFLRLMDRMETGDTPDPDSPTDWRDTLDSYWGSIEG